MWSWITPVLLDITAWDDYLPWSQKCWVRQPVTRVSNSEIPKRITATTSTLTAPKFFHPSPALELSDDDRVFLIFKCFGGTSAKFVFRIGWGLRSMWTFFARGWSRPTRSRTFNSWASSCMASDPSVRPSASSFDVSRFRTARSATPAKRLISLWSYCTLEQTAKSYLPRQINTSEQATTLTRRELILPSPLCGATRSTIPLLGSRRPWNSISGQIQVQSWFPSQVRLGLRPQSRRGRGNVEESNFKK